RAAACAVVAARAVVAALAAARRVAGRRSAGRSGAPGAAGAVARATLVVAAGDDGEAERGQPEREDDTTHRSHGTHDAPLPGMETGPGAAPPGGPGGPAARPAALVSRRAASSAVRSRMHRARKKMRPTFRAARSAGFGRRVSAGSIATAGARR